MQVNFRIKLNMGHFLNLLRHDINYFILFLLLLMFFATIVIIIVDCHLGALLWGIRFRVMRSLKDPIRQLCFPLKEAFSHTIEVLLNLREVTLHVFIA